MDFNFFFKFLSQKAVIFHTELRPFLSVAYNMHETVNKITSYDQFTDHESQPCLC